MRRAEQISLIEAILGALGRLILDTGQAFGAAENRHDVKDRRGYGPPRQGRPERLGNLAQLLSAGRGERFDDILQERRPPVADLIELGLELAQQGAGLALEQLLGLIV